MFALKKHKRHFVLSQNIYINILVVHPSIRPAEYILNTSSIRDKHKQK